MKIAEVTKTALVKSMIMNGMDKYETKNKSFTFF